MLLTECWPLSPSRSDLEKSNSTFSARTVVHLARHAAVINVQCQALPWPAAEEIRFIHCNQASPLRVTALCDRHGSGICMLTGSGIEPDKRLVDGSDQASCAQCFTQHSRSKCQHHAEMYRLPSRVCCQGLHDRYSMSLRHLLYL